MDTGLEARLIEVEAGLSGHLCDVTGGSYSDRTTNPVHIKIAQGLGIAHDLKATLAALGINAPLQAPSKDAYLNGDWTTTISTDIAEPHDIMLPAKVLHRLYSRPHEHGHVEQYKEAVKQGIIPAKVSFPLLYLAGVVFHAQAGEAFVGKVEADQYATSSFVKKWFSGVLDPANLTIRPLIESYNLLNIGSVVAQQIFLSHHDTMSEDGVPNVHICKVTADYLEANARDLKGRIPW